MQAPSKVCPIVLRNCNAVEVLAFEHPSAGLQLVKGTIELGETPAEAAVRELREESGLEASAVADLGLWESGHLGHVWSFQLCESASPVFDRWTHRTEDDGGHEFAFFWQALHAEPSEHWHPVYRRALAHIRGLSFNMSIDTDPQQQEAASPLMLVVRSSLR